MLPFHVLARAAAITTAAIAQNHLPQSLHPIQRRQLRRNAVVIGQEGSIEDQFSEQFKHIFPQLGNQAFKRLFRMTRGAFLKLLLKLTTHIRRQKQAETDYRTAILPTDVRLAMKLRILAGTKFLHVALT